MKKQVNWALTWGMFFMPVCGLAQTSDMTANKADSTEEIVDVKVASGLFANSNGWTVSTLKNNEKGQPICKERHIFRSDGSYVVYSGDEITEGKWNLVPYTPNLIQQAVRSADDFGNFILYRTAVKTNQKRDCLGNRTTVRALKKQGVDELQVRFISRNAAKLFYQPVITDPATKMNFIPKVGYFADMTLIQK